MFDISIYSDLLRIAKKITWGKNFDAEDLVHEIYLQEYNYTLNEKGKIKTALRNVARLEINNSVWFQVNYQVKHKDYICSKCKDNKPIAAFRIRNDRTGCSYVESICNDCKKESSKDYYYTNNDKHKAGMARYRESNAEAIRASKRAYYLANREKMIQRSKDWQKEQAKKRSLKDI